jgi:hypothetical protein
MNRDWWVLPLAIMACHVGATVVYAASTERNIADVSRKNVRVDHGFAVSRQRFTLGMPEGRHKTLIDLWEPGLALRWSRRSLLDVDCFRDVGLIQPSEELKIVPEVPPDWHRSYRRIGNAPLLAMRYQGAKGQLLLESQGGVDVDLVRIVLTSADEKPLCLAIEIHSANARCGENPALIREDKSLLCLAAGDLSWKRFGVSPDGLHSGLEIALFAGKDSRTVWLVIPHRADARDTAAYRARDWAATWDQGLNAWQQTLARAVRFSIPDADVAEAYYACLADQFILREPIRGGIGFLCGTDGYRCVNAYETDVHVQAMLRAGYFQEAWQAAEVFLPLQNSNGCWTDYTPWLPKFWYLHGNMPMMYNELYRFTGDKQRMAAIYPRLARLARWSEGERAKSKSWPRSDPRYGLMPPGEGDSGLERDLPPQAKKNVFFPHNAGNVTGLRVTAELAKEFGTKEERAELEAAYKDARQCLLRSMEHCAVAFQGGRYVPASIVPRGGGSTANCVAFAYPGRLVPYDHPLVSGTLAWYESRPTRTGIPLGGGWLAEGIWPGGAMDCPAPVYLRRGEIDRLSNLVYGGLNCASPVWTWPEERGPDPGSSQISGDLQEAWFPVHFCRLLRDCLLYEEDGVLHLAEGVPRFWYTLGGAIGVERAPSHFGTVSYCIHCDLAGRTVAVVGTVGQPEHPQSAILQMNLPDGWRLAGVAEGNLPNVKLRPDRIAFRAIGQFQIVLKTSTK